MFAAIIIGSSFFFFLQPSRVFSVLLAQHFFQAIGGMVTMLHALAGEKLADTVDTLERIGGELFDPALLESLPEKLGQFVRIMTNYQYLVTPK